MFFRAGEFQADTAQSAEWNRGAYLVNGAAHCVACHGGRNWLGATRDAGFGGGLMAAGVSKASSAWYAPGFNRADEASVADWPIHDIVALLRDGAAPRGRANGPMAEVVRQSTQHLPPADLRAMAVYLQSLPSRAAEPADTPPTAVDDPRRLQGAKLYADHCATCHGDSGEGGQLDQLRQLQGELPAGRLVIPALAGNRLVTMQPPANLVRAIALGGFGAATAADPRPFGMPPYAHVLSDEQIGAVATYLRSSWGAQAAPVSSADVARWRGGS
jgi:mono/diheme cytochrome c family protein